MDIIQVEKILADMQQPAFRRAQIMTALLRDAFQPIPEHVDIYREINENVYKHLSDTTDALLRKSHEILAKHS